MCLQPFKYKCPEYINLCASGIWNLRPITPYTDHSLFCALTLSTVHFSVVWKLLCSRWPALAFLRGLKKGWLWQNEALWCFKLQICEPKSRLICTSGCKNRYYLWTNQLTERLQWKQVGSKRGLAVQLPFSLTLLSEHLSLEGRPQTVAPRPGVEKAAYNPPFVGTSQNNSQQDMAHYISSVILFSKWCLSLKRGWGSYN